MTWSSWRPVVIACLLGAAIGLIFTGKPPPRPRLSKAKKREAKRAARKRGRTATNKRARSKRKEVRARLAEEMGAEEFKKMIHLDRQQKQEQQERLQAAIGDPDSLQLVVDLNWGDSASGKELASLVKQLCYVYNRVKVSLAPPVLTLASYRGRVAVALNNAGAGSWLADRNPLGVLATFNRQNVVYLSPDATEPLENVLASEVYVVGGIVDRTLSKEMTLSAAEMGGVRAVRLPFDEYLPHVLPNDRVLTVCAAVGVLMGVHAGESWQEALEKSVPRRGLAKTVQRARGGAWRGVQGSQGSGWGMGNVANLLNNGVLNRGCGDGVIATGGSFVSEVECEPRLLASENEKTKSL